MASLRKRGKVWYFTVIDAEGIRRERKGCSDRRATEELARHAESEAARIKAGLVDPRDLARREHAGRPIAEHIEAWGASLEAKGSTPKHVALSVGRVRRLVAVVKGASMAELNPPRNATRADLARLEAVLSDWLAPARLADLSADAVQSALRSLVRDGLGLATVNHHRAAIKAFAKWAWKAGRLAFDPLAALSGYNALEDPRHDRRAIGIDELRRLVEAAHEGPDHLGVPGPSRALLYRLAVASGLRYGELQSITPASFDWTAEPPTVAVTAAYAKNGQSATLPLPDDLADDLRPLVASVAAGEPVFRLPADKGANLLRFDLARAKIDYVDASGRFFDFHALRGMLATLADAAGVTPRVVQKLMRHSTLELTGKYTRPRVVDVNAAALAVPSLRPDSDRPNASTLAATGTDVQPISKVFAAHLPRAGDVLSRDLSGSDVMTVSDAQSSMNVSQGERQCLTHPVGSIRAKGGSTGVGTRTPDLRIMRPPL